MKEMGAEEDGVCVPPPSGFALRQSEPGNPRF